MSEHHALPDRNLALELVRVTEAGALAAEAAALKVGKGNLTIVAPIDGTVMNKPPQLGEYIGPQPPGISVDMGGFELTNGDGLLLIGGRTLLVVQNRSNQIAVVKLDRGYRSGRVLRTLRHDDFDVPTTVAKKRWSLFLPNARFGTTAPDSPDEAPYWVTRLGFGRHR